MPRMRRRPNAVASQATEGAMKICEPIDAVESQAPSSKPSEKAPRRSGNPTEVSRLSKCARKEPSSTAPTANKGCGAMPPRESGPCPASLLSAIRPRFAGVNSGHDRHPRQQAIQQRLALVEGDPNRDALNHLGEIAGGVVGRQQRKLRSAGRGDSLDAAVQPLAWESIDGHVDGLTRSYPGQLGLLVVGDDVDVRQRHDIDEVAPDIDVVVRLNLPLTNDAVERCCDLGVPKLEPGRGQRGSGRRYIRRTLLLGPGQHLELMALRGDRGLAGTNVGLGAGVVGNRLFEFLPRAGIRLLQRLLPFLLLTGLDLARERGDALRLGLRDGRVLQLDLVVEIFERWLGGGERGRR